MEIDIFTAESRQPMLFCALAACLLFEGNINNFNFFLQKGIYFRYRGKDSRNNLHVLPTGEIVYFIGAVVVLFDPDEMSQRHYTQHTSEIKW